MPSLAAFDAGCIFSEREKDGLNTFDVELLWAGFDWHLTLSSARQNRLAIPTIRIPATPFANRWNLLNESSKLHGSPRTSRASVFAASWRYLVAEFGFLGANLPLAWSLGPAERLWIFEIVGIVQFRTLCFYVPLGLSEAKMHGNMLL